MSETTSGRRYVDALDGLRALCVLGVLGYHMGVEQCSGGLLGVTVLFVLSGYLITSQLVSTYAKNHRQLSLREFWMKRVRRLMPSVVVLVVVTAALCTLFNHVLLTKMRPDIVPALLMYLNWAKIFSNESYFAAAGAPSPLTHFWSLAIEAQFYLVWPPILLLLMNMHSRKRHVAIGCVVLAILSAVLMAMTYSPNADPSRAYYGTDTRAMSLLLGCALALVWPFGRASRADASTMSVRARVGVEIAGIGSVGALVFLMATTEGYSAWSYRGGILLCSVVSVIAVAALMPAGSLVSKVASLPPLVWLGKRSYALYLWHYPIVLLLTNVNSTVEPSLVVRALQVGLSLGAAGLSYRFVEEPLRHASLPSGAAVVDWVRRRRIPAVAMAVVLAVSVAGVALVPSANAFDGQGEVHKVSAAALKRPLVDGVYDVVLIGDSVPLDAYDQLASYFPYGLIDCKISRQASAAIELYDSYRDSGVVGDTVIFCVGTNGALTEKQLDGMVSDVGSDKQIWFVNNRMPDDWQDANNELLAQCAEKYDNVGLVDWYSYSEGHDDWFWNDGTHTRPDGSVEYAKLIFDTTGYEAPTQANTTYDVLFLGDGISLDASDALSAAFPNGAVDCAEGRLPGTFAETYDSYRDQGVIGGRVVISLGSNGPLQKADLDALVSDIGPDVQVWFVNTRVSGAWCEDNNELLAQLAQDNANVHVIDWYQASVGHDEYFAGDGMHLSEAGAAAYAATVSAVLAAA